MIGIIGGLLSREFRGGEETVLGTSFIANENRIMKEIMVINTGTNFGR